MRKETLFQRLRLLWILWGKVGATKLTSEKDRISDRDCVRVAWGILYVTVRALRFMIFAGPQRQRWCRLDPEWMQCLAEGVGPRRRETCDAHWCEIHPPARPLIEPVIG